jgi:hypothetical protein
MSTSIPLEHLEAVRCRHHRHSIAQGRDLTKRSHFFGISLGNSIEIRNVRAGSQRLAQTTNSETRQ